MKLQSLGIEALLIMALLVYYRREQLNAIPSRTTHTIVTFMFILSMCECSLNYELANNISFCNYINLLRYL
jgi:hypothetical protein